jgi:PAS domain-containing protein
MDRSGRVVLLVPEGRDITERKLAEDALRRSEAILAQAGEMAHLGAWWIEISNHDDLVANPLRWSDEVYRIFGYAPRAVEVTSPSLRAGQPTTAGPSPTPSRRPRREVALPD